MTTKETRDFMEMILGVSSDYKHMAGKPAYLIFLNDSFNFKFISEAYIVLWNTQI